MKECVARTDELIRSTPRLDAYRHLLDTALAEPAGHSHIPSILFNMIKKTGSIVEVMLKEVTQALETVAACPTYAPTEVDGIAACGSMLWQLAEAQQKLAEWNIAGQICISSFH
jgi:hypothetical protein